VHPGVRVCPHIVGTWAYRNPHSLSSPTASSVQCPLPIRRRHLPSHAKPPQLADRCASAAPNDHILASVPGAHPAISARHSATLSAGRLLDGLTNVDPMSEQPETQGNTSPPASVRSSTPPNPAHGALKPSADEEAVTPKTLAQKGRSKTAPNVQQSTLWKSSIDRPQLSERDSIFATTYLVADTPTSSPRTSAHQPNPGDNDAPEHSLSDMAAPMPPQRRLIDAPVFRRKQSTYPPVDLDDHHTVLTTHFNSRMPVKVGMGPDGVGHSPPPYMSPVDSPVQRPVTPRHPDVQSALDERLVDSEERKRNIAWRGEENRRHPGQNRSAHLSAESESKSLFTGFQRRRW
jgi:hypothetical protein